MNGDPATKGSGMNEKPPTMRPRSQSISTGLLHPAYIPYEGTVLHQQQVAAAHKKSVNIENRHKQSATIHGMIEQTRKPFFDDIFTLSLPGNIHALKPRKESCLDELPLSELGRLQALSEQVSEVVPATPLVSERTIRMQMLDQYLSQRSADLVTTADVSQSRFFHLSFHHHLISELKKISHSSDKHWLYWYMHILFKYTGLKHIALTLLLVGYTFLGGAVFMKLEHDYEREMTINQGASVMAEIFAFASTINRTAFALHSEAEITAQITELYAKLRDVDGGLKSSLDRLGPGNATWSFESATFYAMTLLSTIGYGTIACKTVIGKVITVIYVTIGLPLMLIVLRDLGLILFVALQKGYNRLHTKRNKQDKIDKEEVAMTFPLPLAVLLVYIYLMIMTLIVFFLDEEAGSGVDGLSFGDSFYFAFISLTTIGLGDVMPNNIHDSVFFCGILLSGLALISIVNTATYARIERKYFNAMGALEHVLMELESEKQLKEDEQKPKEQPKVKRVQPICHELIGIVRLAAMVIPSLDDQLDDAIAKANEATVTEENRATHLPITPDLDTGYFSKHTGFRSMRRSFRKKYETLKTLVGGGGSNTVPSQNTNPPPHPPIPSIFVDSFAPNTAKQPQKQFIVCPVSDEQRNSSAV